MSRVSIHRALALTAAAAAAAAPATAAAQSFTSDAAATRNWAKTEVILGGAPSALQAILAQQQGVPLAKARPLQPAYHSRPAVTAATLRRPHGLRATFSSSRPDVFGSVALPVGRTRLNARWRQVQQARIGGTAARFAANLRNSGAVERLEAVNRYVNHRVRFVEDQRQHGRADVWSPAAQTLDRGRGDCEDFAIAKLQMLRRAGLSDRDLYLVIVKDLVSRRDHAVLVVRAAERMFVLDNGTDNLLESDSIRDYRPVLSFAANGAWTHGYRVGSSPQAIASADFPARRPAPAADGQRSRSASLLAFETGLNK